MKLVLAMCAGLLAAPAQKEAQPQKPEPKIGIQFQGWLPGSVDPELEGSFEVDFRIYKSPQGGEAIWREVRRVDGRRVAIVSANIAGGSLGSAVDAIRNEHLGLSNPLVSNKLEIENINENNRL